jgi:hypothetical protein
VLLAKIEDDGGEVGSKVIAYQNLDIVLGQSPDVGEEHL